MDFEKAKALLIENAVGQNNYEELTTWSELVDAAEFEKQCARDRILQLQRIDAAANNQS